MPSIDPDHLDDEPAEGWEDAAGRHFTGPWQHDAEHRALPATTRRPFTRSATTDTGTTPEEAN